MNIFGNDDANQNKKPYISDYIRQNHAYLMQQSLNGNPDDKDHPDYDDDINVIWKSLNDSKENDEFYNVFNHVYIDENIPYEEPIEASPVIAYPRHGRNGDKFLINLDDERLHYCESLGGDLPHFNLLASPPSDKYQLKKLAMMLLEGGLLNIAVADERIGREISNVLKPLRIYNIKILLMKKIKLN